MNRQDIFTVNLAWKYSSVYQFSLALMQISLFLVSCVWKDPVSIYFLKAQLELGTVEGVFLWGCTIQVDGCVRVLDGDDEVELILISRERQVWKCKFEMRRSMLWYSNSNKLPLYTCRSHSSCCYIVVPRQQRSNNWSCLGCRNSIKYKEHQTKLGPSMSDHSRKRYYQIEHSQFYEWFAYPIFRCCAFTRGKTW